MARTCERLSENFFIDEQAVLTLVEVLKAWGGPDFMDICKNAIQSLDHAQLPLQQGLSQSSFVSDSPMSVVILNISETAAAIQVKAGIFYAGIIAGSCCADDPTPPCEQTEYCELLFAINKTTAETTVTSMPN